MIEAATFAEDFLKKVLAEKAAIDTTLLQLRQKQKELEESGNRTEAYKIWAQKSETLKASETTAKILLQAENAVKATKNGGGLLLEYEDKRGGKHNYIPDFRGVSTQTILFNEETILTEPKPYYVPELDLDALKRKGFIFDSIRIGADSYLTALGSYSEEKANQFILLTLDQLVLTLDYYTTYQKALYQAEADRKNKRSLEYYDSLSEQKRAGFFNQKDYYNVLPASVRKKVTRETWDKLNLSEKEAYYKPYKKYNPERIKGRLDEKHMYSSLHKMYETFVNPEAKEPRPRIANAEVWQYWEIFRAQLDFKIIDLKTQRQEISDIRQKALETSFGLSNTSDQLLEEGAILVKRQDGTNISTDQVDEIRTAWNDINKTFGNLRHIASQVKLKVSHAQNTHIFASKAIGVYVGAPFFTIGVSHKYGPTQFKDTFAHEAAHLIDNFIGTNQGKRYATDNYESNAGQIAFMFRSGMNKKEENSDYIRSTKECFARALQQFYAIETRGEGAKIFYSEGLKEETPYFFHDHYVPKEYYFEKIRPLILSFQEEHKELFKIGFQAQQQTETEPEQTDIPAAIEANAEETPRTILEEPKEEPTPAQEPLQPSPEIVKDAEQRQRLINAYRETDLILRAGKIDKRKISPEEREAIEQQQKRTLAKLGGSLERIYPGPQQETPAQDPEAQPEPEKQSLEATAAKIKRYVENATKEGRNIPEEKIIALGLEYEKARKKISQRIDEKSDSARRLTPNATNLLRWINSPGKFDLIGVDTFQRTDATADYKSLIAAQKFWHNTYGIKI